MLFAAGHRKVYVGELRDWMYIAGNCYDIWLDRQQMSIGMDHVMKFGMRGTSASNNNWNA